MADPDRPLAHKDPYEDDVSGRQLATDNLTPAPTSKKYLNPMWSLLTVIALFAAIVVVAVGIGHREQQAQPQAPQIRTVPSTTGSAPAR